MGACDGRDVPLTTPATGEDGDDVGDGVVGAAEGCRVGTLDGDVVGRSVCRRLVGARTVFGVGALVGSFLCGDGDESRNGDGDGRSVVKGVGLFVGFFVGGRRRGGAVGRAVGRNGPPETALARSTIAATPTSASVRARAMVRARVCSEASSGFPAERRTKGGADRRVDESGPESRSRGVWA